MGVAPIPFTAICEYGRIYNVCDLTEFIYYIREMDDEYLRIANEQRSDQTNSNKVQCN